jgi:hypothetical protein
VLPLAAVVSCAVLGVATYVALGAVAAVATPYCICEMSKKISVSEKPLQRDTDNFVANNYKSKSRLKQRGPESVWNTVEADSLPQVYFTNRSGLILLCNISKFHCLEPFQPILGRIRNDSVIQQPLRRRRIRK